MSLTIASPGQALLSRSAFPLRPLAKAIRSWRPVGGSWIQADATINAVSLDAVGRVPWWPEHDNEVTLHHALVRVIADTHRHAGILREQLDGSVGMNEGNLSTTLSNAAERDHQRARLEEIARLKA